MADDVDITEVRLAKEEAQRQKVYEEAARAIPKGNPGDCDLCGEWSGRLVRGVCAPCRDHHKLP